MYRKGKGNMVYKVKDIDHAAKRKAMQNKLPRARVPKSKFKIIRDAFFVNPLSFPWFN